MQPVPVPSLQPPHCHPLTAAPHCCPLTAAPSLQCMGMFVAVHAANSCPPTATPSLPPPHCRPLTATPSLLPLTATPSLPPSHCHPSLPPPRCHPVTAVCGYVCSSTCSQFPPSHCRPFTAAPLTAAPSLLPPSLPPLHCRPPHCRPLTAAPSLLCVFVAVCGARECGRESSTPDGANRPERVSDGLHEGRGAWGGRTLLLLQVQEAPAGGQETGHLDTAPRTRESHFCGIVSHVHL